MGRLAGTLSVRTKIEVSTGFTTFFKKFFNEIVVIPNPLALDWSILSEVNRIVLSFLYFKATDSIMQSGLCLSNPLGNNERLASSMWE